MIDGASPARDAAPSNSAWASGPPGVPTPKRSGEPLMTGGKGSATGAAATTVKPVDALTVPDTAWTSRTGWDVCGITTSAVKPPEALTLKATELCRAPGPWPG